jgi:hypothetical protein
LKKINLKQLKSTIQLAGLLVGIACTVQASNTPFVLLGTALNFRQFTFAEYPQIRISKSNPVVSWTERSRDMKKNAVVVAQWDGKHWTPLTRSLMENENYVPFCPALTISPKGVATVAWREHKDSMSTPRLRIKQQVKNGWVDLEKNLPIKTNEAISCPALTTSLSGHPIITFTQGIQLTAQVEVAEWDGTAWKRFPSIKNPSKLFAYENVNVFSQNGRNLTVSYSAHLGNNDKDIQINRWDGKRWLNLGSPINKGIAKQGNHPNLAFDERNQPVVSWFEDSDTNADLRVSRWTGTKWLSLGGVLNQDTVYKTFAGAIAIYKGRIFVSGTETSYGGTNLFVKEWIGGKWQATGERLNIDENTFIRGIDMTILNGAPLLTWNESVDRGSNIYVKRR